MISNQVSLNQTQPYKPLQKIIPLQPQINLKQLILIDQSHQDIKKSDQPLHQFIELSQSEKKTSSQQFNQSDKSDPKQIEIIQFNEISNGLRIQSQVYQLDKINQQMALIQNMDNQVPQSKNQQKQVNQDNCVVLGIQQQIISSPSSEEAQLIRLDEKVENVQNIQQKQQIEKHPIQILKNIEVLSPERSSQDQIAHQQNYQLKQPSINNTQILNNITPQSNQVVLPLEPQYFEPTVVTIQYQNSRSTTQLSQINSIKNLSQDQVLTKKIPSRNTFKQMKDMQTFCEDKVGCNQGGQIKKLSIQEVLKNSRTNYVQDQIIITEKPNKCCIIF